MNNFGKIAKKIDLLVQRAQQMLQLQPREEKFAEKIGVLVQKGGTAIIGQINLSGKSSQERRNREKLLDNVRTAWIEGVLESSLHERVLITLGLEERPQAVDRPWSLQVKEPDKPSRPLPEGTSIMEPFDQLGAGGTLVVLGDPGSGKTLTLLELARDLIKRAEEEADRPIPVVLNLSSWAIQKNSLAAWIAQEIEEKYGMLRNISEEWVKGQKLTLLLDGLDEIRDLSARDKCVAALNAFQREHETAMVVCCRVKDYEKLDNMLEGKSAVVIQPLSPEQTRIYLDQLQVDLTGLKSLLGRDNALQELAQSPLMLNIMVLAYQGVEIEEGFETVTTKERMKKLFDDYIDRMFTRSRVLAYAKKPLSQEKERYSRQQATLWLAWLARQMLQRSQTVFLIEKLQPSWLANSNLNVLYKILVGLTVGVVSGLTVGLTVGSIFGLMARSIIELRGLIFGPILGLISGLIFGLIGGLIGGSTKLFEEIKTVEAVKWSWKNPWKNILYWSRFGLMIGLVSGLVLGLFSKLIIDRSTQSVSTGKHIFGVSDRLINWMNEGPISLMNGELILGLISWTYDYGDLIFGLIGGLFGGMVFGLIGGLLGGPISIDIENKNQTNQGIWVSAKNAIIFGSIFLLISGSIGVLIAGLSGLTIDLIFGLIAGLANGGLAFLQHFTLRFLLYRTNCMPWKLVPFLQFCTEERLFLYRVGGGYIFVHRLLMDHFAQMEE